MKKKYIGTKMLEAVPMNRGEYNRYRGWQLPEDEDPEDEGYLVTYQGGYESWSPKAVFEEAYRDANGLSFGIALELLKKGCKVSREGWNGKGLVVVYQRGYPEGIPCNRQTARTWSMKEGELFRCEPYLQIRTATGSHAMWVPSIGDCLAEDWFLVDETPSAAENPLDYTE